MKLKLLRRLRRSLPNGLRFDLDASTQGWKPMPVRVYSFVSAALVTAMMPAAAWADDPHDPTMRSAKARARDRVLTRQLNLEEMARIRKRDALQANEQGNARATNSYTARDYTARSRDHARAMASYTDDRARYERDVAAWRRAVAACRAGDYAACE